MPLLSTQLEWRYVCVFQYTSGNWQNCAQMKAVHEVTPPKRYPPLYSQRAISKQRPQVTTTASKAFAGPAPLDPAYV